MKVPAVSVPASPDARSKQQRLLTNADLDAKTGTRKSFRYAEERAKRFPARVKIGRLSRWVESEVDDWIIERIRSWRARSDERT